MTQAPSEWNVLSMLEWATSYFEEKGIRNPRFSIEWLLAHVLDVRRLDLYLLYDRPLDPDELAYLKPLVKRRSEHEPLQYITGETDFFNVTIKVRPGVLIPRMETEQLVEMVLQQYPGNPNLRVLDIGTGSGCIPIALKKESPSLNIFASDISEDALEIARENATKNHTDITFIKDDILSPRAFKDGEKFDIIISNPPYILEEEREDLDLEVREYEPSLALFCSSTSSMFSAIHNFALNHLHEEGQLYLELHENHANEVLEIFNTQNWSASVVKDYGNKDRFLIAKKVK